MKTLAIIGSVLLVLHQFALAQNYNTFEANLTIPVKIDSTFIKNPWTGGFNTPIFSTIDLNGDGLKDLFIFDKNGGRYTTYLNDGITGQVSYTNAPLYNSKFPPMHDWALLYDFDCDGLEDIFTHNYIGGMDVWHNDYNMTTGLSFSLHTSLIYSHYGVNYVNLYVSGINLPAFVDIDGDSDMDILTFSVTGNNVEYHKNYSIENNGVCGLEFYLEDDCWGKFLLSNFENIAILNSCLKPNENKAQSTGETEGENFRNLHSGSCMIAVNFNGDSLQDVMNGDLLGTNMLYLENTGTVDTAHVQYQDSLWPSYDTSVNFVTFPAAYNIDVDGDSNKDILITSCISNGAAENFNNVWFYKNTGTNSNAVFDYQKNNLFQDEMIEVGSGANVALFDANNDGLLDMIIGNFGYFNIPLPYVSGLSYYKNIGTLSSPSFELVTRDYMNLNSLGITGIFPSFGDIDGDNDMDLLIGSTDGYIHLFDNNAGAGNTPNYVLAINGINYQGIDVGLFSAPQMIDVDRDGLIDLLIGERQGNINYFRNTGTTTTPVFTLISSIFGGVDVIQHSVSITGYGAPCLVDLNGQYELFVGSESGFIYHYNNIDGNLNGNFTLLDSTFKGINEKPRITIAINDINNDGLYDILTGNDEGGVKFYNQKVSGLGIVKIQINNFFDLYPVPVTDAITVKFNPNLFDKVKAIELYNSQGMQIYSNKKPKLITSINAEQMSNGMYFLKVNTDDIAIGKKVLILRNTK